MTVLSTVPINEYVANGSVTTFAYSFKIIYVDQLQVIVDGSIVTTGFTVTDVGNLNGGNVIFDVAPTNGVAVTLRRISEKIRETDFQEGGGLSSSLLDNDFDYLTMLTQENDQYALSTNLLGNYDAKNKNIVNIADPVNPQDAATLNYGENNWGGVAADQAAASAAAAAVSEANAAASESASATSETNAATSETNAATSEANAAASESAAAISETNAATSETNAAASASAAAISETNAANSESAASTSETNAAASELNAAASASAAATSETNAATSETNAAASESASANNVTYSAEWANKAEDSLISVAAGGDGVNDYSALHWATKAEAAAASFNLEPIQTGDALKTLRIKSDETGIEYVDAATQRTNLDVYSKTEVNTKQPVDGIYIKQVIPNSYHHTVVLTSDNRVITWGLQNSLGYQGNGMTSPNKLYNEVQFPAELKGVNITSIHGTTYGTFVLFENGDLYCWGWNNYGNLGLGDTTNRLVPTLTAQNVVEVVTPVGDDYVTNPFVANFIKKSDGTWWGAGANSQGNLGIGNTTHQYSWTQTTSPTASPIVKIFATPSTTQSSFMKTQDGKIYACGYNGVGQLGLGDTTARSSWTEITYFTGLGVDIVDIQNTGYGDSGSTGYNLQNTLFLDSNGQMYGCGRNSLYELLDGTTTQRTTPQTITLTKTVEKFVIVGRYSTAIWVKFTDGTTARWSYNARGQCADGTSTSPRSTAYYDSMTVTDIIPLNSTGRYGWICSVAVLGTDENIYVAGANDYAELGLGSTSTAVTSLTKLPIRGNASDVLHFSTGGYYGARIFSRLVFNNDNKIYMSCSDNLNYELGIDGGATYTMIPKIIY